MTEQDRNGREERKTADRDMAKPQQQVGNPAFIREKIMKKPVRMRDRIYRVVSLLLLAAVLGGVAAVSFVLVSHQMEQQFVAEESEETVVIPKDTAPWETQTSAQETEPASETLPVETETQENLDELIQSAMDEKKLELSDYKRLSSLVTAVWKDTAKGFVTITSVRQNEDWFDNVYENEGQTSGIVMEISGRDVLILTRYDAIQETDELEVAFANGTRAKAQVRGTDSMTGLAVLNVPVAALSSADLQMITPVVLGNSYALSVGNPVIAAGDPYGMVGSMAAGTVVYTGVESHGADTDIRLIYTNLGLPSQSGGFLLNLDGEVVGMFTAEYSGSDGALTPAVGISNIKGIMENLCNGKGVAYLGVEGQSVTTEISGAYDLPVGVYVTGTVQDSPAYRAGIQNGDVIVRISEKEIATMRDIHETLLMLEPDTEVTVTVMRRGMDDTRELNFNVLLKSR